MSVFIHIASETVCAMHKYGYNMCNFTCDMPNFTMVRMGVYYHQRQAASCKSFPLQLGLFRENSVFDRLQSGIKYNASINNMSL